jgi:hypothetical protein
LVWERIYRRDGRWTPFVRARLRLVPCDCWWLRPEVRAFAVAMEQQLQRHDDRPGWKGETPSWLLYRVRQEMGELAEEVLGPCVPAEVLGEAAGVANFAMMVADVCGAFELGTVRDGR